MNELKISKELIRNVLEKETENLPDDFTFDIIDNYIIFADDGECMFEVNIYEFAYKCKVWVFNKYKIYLSSELGEDSEVSLFWTANFKIKRENKSFYGDTEFEAIIKACEWILKELNENR